MIKLKDIMPPGYVKVDKPEKPQFDRNAYYEEYITNVVPTNFTVKRVDNKIIIRVANK